MLRPAIIRNRDRCALACGSTVTDAPAAAAVNPKNGIAVIRLQGKTELHLNLLRPSNKIEYLFRLLRQGFQFASQPRQRLRQRKKLVSILFEKFPPRFE